MLSGWWKVWGSLPVDQPCINLQIIMKFRESLLIIHMFPHKKDCYTVSSEPTQAATGPGDWTVVDTYLSFQDCLQSTPRYTEQLGITIIANVSMLLLGSMTWEQWKKAKNTNPANQDKQTGKEAQTNFARSLDWSWSRRSTPTLINDFNLVFFLLPRMHS